jgi:hypothetical protein
MAVFIGSDRQQIVICARSLIAQQLQEFKLLDEGFHFFWYYVVSLTVFLQCWCVREAYWIPALIQCMCRII